MTEELIIVDEFDKPIEFKQRHLLKKNDIYRVAVLWIINSRGEILLSKRALSKDHDPGKWGPAVAGTLEKGETYYSNIIKEAKEEIGLTNTYPVRGEKERVKGKYNYFRQWHFLKINQDAESFSLDKKEVSKVKWFKKEELLKEIKKNPKNFLDSVKQMMKS